MLAKRAKEWDKKLLEQGRQEGRQKVWQEGQRQGEARIVLRLLEQKFGPLDTQSQEQVTSASREQLDAWTDRILVAEKISDVFQES